MKFRNLMLITFVLLAILTIGTVSASDDADFNETLTVNTVEEVSADASLEDNVISEDSDDLIASSEDDYLGDPVGEENLHPWVSTHEIANADWDPWIVNVHGDDNVQDGSVELSISRDGSIVFEGEKLFGEDSDEHNDIIWTLDELSEDALNEAGTYNIALKYCGDEEFDLGDFTITLTNLNFNYEEEVAVNNQFDVIRVWEQNYNVLLYVDGSERESGRNNPMCWSLSDLGIEQAGEYSIRIETHDEDDEFVEEYEYVLNVYDFDESEIAVFSNVYEIYDVSSPVILIYRPEGKEGDFIISLNGEELEIQLEFTDNWAELTLDDLGIDQNDGYSVSITYADDEHPDGIEIFNRDLYVNGFITEDSFDPWVSTHEPIDADWDPSIVNVHIDDNIQEGEFNLTIMKSDGTTFNYYKSVDDADENNDIIWSYVELRDFIDETGDYTINLTYSNGDVSIPLRENHVFTLTQFDYNTREGNFHVSYPFDVIRVWDEDVNVEVYVDDNPEPFTGSEDPLRWTLNDLGITSPGEYTITIHAQKDEFEETFTFTINLDDDAEDFRLISNDMGVQSWDMDGPVLYLISPEDMIGKSVTLSINGDESELEITDSIMNWTLEDLGIEENDGFEVTVYFDGDEVAGTYFDVWGFAEPINVEIWDEDERGKLYNDYTGDVVSVDVPEDKCYGSIIVIVNGERQYSWETDWDERYHGWSLDDLEITEDGEYAIVVKHVVYDEDDEIESEETLAEGLLNVTTFNYDAFRAVLDKDENVIRVFCPDYAEGTVNITVERENEDGEPETVYENGFTIEDEDKGTWKEWSLKEIGFARDGCNYIFHVKVCDSEDEEIYSYSDGHSAEGLEINIWDSEESPLYTDTLGTVIHIRVPEGISGFLDVIVDNAVKYHTIITSQHDSEDYFDGYEWDLKSLGITQAGVHNVTLKFEIDGEETVEEYSLYVEDFDNSTFRAKVIGDDEPFYLYLFTPAGQTGTVSLIFSNWDDELEERIIEDTVTFELNESYWNKWVALQESIGYDSDDVTVIVNGEEIHLEHSYWDVYNAIDVNTEMLFSGDDTVIWVYANTSDNNYTLNITSGDYIFTINVSELGDYEWVNGNYRYFLTLENLDSFETFNDKALIKIFYDVGNGMSLRARWLPYSTYALEKNDEFIRLYEYGALRINLIKFEWAHEEDEEYDDDNIVKISVPDSLNIHETALVHFSYGDHEVTKSLSDLYSEYDYGFLGVDYYISWDDLSLEGVQGNYVLNISVTANDEIIGFKNYFINYDDEEGWGFDDYADSIKLRFYYGQIGDLEFGMDGNPDMIMILSIPKYLNVTEGTIIITDEAGEVIFTKSLSEFEENFKSFDDPQTDEYWISDNVTEFDYSIFKENVPFTVSFAYGNTSKVYARGVRIGDDLLRINTPELVANFFKITVSEGILVNGSENAIIIECTDDANRQSVPIDMGGGYFVVYVNDKKVENLGRLIRVDDETELETFRLEGGSEGVDKLIIYLSDLNITDNGIYNIRVAHHSELGSTSSDSEVELFNRNFTLTSNVKVDNVTSEVLTGFGMDPVLMYIDTYYGSIDNVTGKITVLNSTGDEIFTSNIRDLSSQDGRYYLKYSDFENKNFGNQITVVYGDGNERGGNTIVNTTWKDIDSSDFNPIVNVTVNDYYGDFINMDLPDLLNDGQIIITIKFKGNHTTNLPNMNVTSDFGSQAVYRFNVADIKANYDTFKLSLSDLGFYEDSGNYDVSVQFTADGTSTLNVTDNTLEVDFLEEILITINETSRYTYELPFAVVRVFEPINAYADLFIDGELYAHATHFDDGVIIFTSSETWTPGVHTAEIRVVQSEFGSVLNSSSVVFETLTKTEGVEVTVPDNVKENENVIIEITVPKAGNVTIKIDNGEKTVYGLVEGKNSIDLGILAYGNRTIWIDYEGEGAFFTNSVYVFVGDDGHWLTLPDPLVLNDDNTLKFDFGEGASGTISIYIDDKFIANRTLVNGAAEFVITEEMFLENYQGELLGASEDTTTVYGKHTYRIVYTGDSTHGGLTRTGEFTVAYIFKDDLIDEYPLRESYDVTVTLPGDATGKVSLTVNNEKYISEVKDGKATFKVTDLPMGAHEVLIEHMDDDKYPYANYTAVLNVSYYGVVGEYSDDEKYVSLMLPENATGNLTIFNGNMHAVVRSEQITNGKITMDLSGLPVGIYEIRAYYEGDDYDVRPFDISFRVMPKVNILQGVVMGDDGNIYLDLDGATGHIVIAMDGLSPVVQEITNGTVNYTFSTEGYFYGNHSVTFLYFGHSFDGDIFYEPDGKTPVEYDLLVLPQNTTGELVSDDEGNYIEVRILREDGSLATDANEFVTFYVNGMKYQVVQAYNGIARLDISKFKNGEYLISWVYSGNKKYASSSGQSTLNVNRKIVAGDASVLYSSNKKYSVTVYNSDKKPAKGVKVTFLINNKVFKTVTTDSKGVASVVITQKPGTYKITSKYGDDIKVTKTLKVTHVVSLKKVKVKRSAKKLVIKATLKKVNGKYLKSKKVTFKFNGKKYTAKTNKKGVAKVTIKSKVLKKLKVGKKVKYQVTYKKDTVKKTVKVKK